MPPVPHPTVVLRDAQAAAATAVIAVGTGGAAVLAAVLLRWELAAVLVLLEAVVLRHLPPTSCRITLDGVRFRWPARRVLVDAGAVVAPLGSGAGVVALRVRPRRGLPFALVTDSWDDPLLLRTALVRTRPARTAVVRSAPSRPATGPEGAGSPVPAAAERGAAR